VKVREIAGASDANSFLHSRFFYKLKIIHSEGRRKSVRDILGAEKDILLGEEKKGRDRHICLPEVPSHQARICRPEARLKREQNVLKCDLFVLIWVACGKVE
jgi:hypothetical protein